MSPTRESQSRRVSVTASTAGTVIEWYDFALYGAASALVFNVQFFGDVDPVAGTLFSFAVYAVGFFVRPLGGVIFGYLGDRLGRKPVLLITVLMMGISTVLVGFLPNFDAIGYLAPSLLIALRVVQGLGAGAEYAGALVVTGESGEHRRGFFTSIPAAAVDISTGLSAGTFALFVLLPAEQFAAWGWRVPFWLGGLGLVVALFIRLRMPETEVFQKLKADTTRDTRSPLKRLFKEHRRELLIAAGINVGANLSYVFQTFALSYSINTLGYPPFVSLIGVVLSAIAGSVATLYWGHLTDRIGRRPVLIGGAIGVIVLVFPFFALIQVGSVPLLFACVIVAHIADRAIFASQAPLYAELFPASVRFSGIATAREVTGALIAGPLPFVATGIVAATGGPWLFAAIVVVLAAVSGYSAFLARETAPEVVRRRDAPREHATS